MLYIRLQRKTSLKRSFAIKAMKFKSSLRSRAVLRIHREIEILEKIPNHPNLVIFEEAIWTVPGWVLLVMGKITGGTLRTRMRHSKVPEHEILHYSYQLLRGLQVLHRHNIVHRDMKPDNCGLELPNPKSGCRHYRQVRLIDYGLSRIVEEKPFRCRACIQSWNKSLYGPRGANTRAQAKLQQQCRYVEYRRYNIPYDYGESYIRWKRLRVRRSTSAR